MNLDRFFNVLALIIVLAMVAVIFKSKETKNVIKAFGNFFAGSINAARQG